MRLGETVKVQGGLQAHLEGWQWWGLGPGGVVLPLGEGGREEEGFQGGGHLRGRWDPQRAFPAVRAASRRERRVKQGCRSRGDAAVAGAARLRRFINQFITIVKGNWNTLFLPGHLAVHQNQSKLTETQMSHYLTKCAHSLQNTPLSNKYEFLIKKKN